MSASLSCKRRDSAAMGRAHDRWPCMLGSAEPSLTRYPGPKPPPFARRGADGHGRRRVRGIPQPERLSTRHLRGMAPTADARPHATARPAPIPPPVRHHKPCGSQAGTGHNWTKRGGVPASPSRFAPDGAAMAGLPELIGLLYRADWTRLSLSAELRSETDRNLLPRPPRENQPQGRWYRGWPAQQQDNGRYVRRGALLIGPGGRWRLECPVPGQGAEAEAAEGNDGERGWSWRPPEVGGPPPLPVKVGVAYPPPPELFCPSGLLGGFTLEVLGPVTVVGRDAIAVAATPRRDVLGSGSAKLAYDRIEVAVDAELGILLRRIETSGG